MDRQPVALAILHAMDVGAGDVDVARRRRVRARHHLEQRGLAGAVRADHADDRGLVDRKIGVERETSDGAIDAPAAVDLANADRATSSGAAISELRAGVGASAPSSRERCRLAGPGDPAAVDDRDMVGDRQRDLGVLLDDERGDALLPQPADGRQHVVDDLRRQALARLVEQDQARAHRAARARSPPSASRRPTGFRLALHQIFERREDLAGLLDASRRGTRVRFCADARDCCATVSVGHSRRSSGTQPMPARAISCVGLRGDRRGPRSGSSPRRGRVRPRIERSIVVLPAPLAPSSANTFAALAPPATRRTAPASRRRTYRSRSTSSIMRTARGWSA